jgi:hypothetical protein
MEKDSLLKTRTTPFSRAMATFLLKHVFFHCGHVRKKCGMHHNPKLIGISHEETNLTYGAPSYMDSTRFVFPFSKRMFTFFPQSFVTTGSTVAEKPHLYLSIFGVVMVSTDTDHGQIVPILF